MTATDERGIASFLVRFTQERWQGEDGRHLRWHGRVRHVQDGEEQGFTDFGEAVAFMQPYLDALTHAAAAGGGTVEQERVMKEGFRLWEQLARSAGQVMAEAMERTLQQSEAVRQQMDDALARSLGAWRDLPLGRAAAGTDEVRALREEVQALRSEVAALRARVGEKTSRRRGKGRGSRGGGGDVV